MRARATGGKIFSGYHQKIGKKDLFKLLRLRTENNSLKYEKSEK